jgi:class 3 adenylate cyclase
LRAVSGDRAWADLLAQHLARSELTIDAHRGRLVDTAGDGVFATFDGPARAVRCALALVGAAQALGVEVRAGVHTGECELDNGSARGMPVHVGARVAAVATSSEVLVSGTVRDLVAGSGLTFEPRGRHSLKGVDGLWTLFRATG